MSVVHVATIAKTGN